MDPLNAAASLGFSLPTPAYLIGAIVFGIIGFAAYRYGKKTSSTPIFWIGLGLMLYPYLVSETWLMYLIGIALCGALYWFRE